MKVYVIVGLAASAAFTPAYAAECGSWTFSSLINEEQAQQFEARVTCESPRRELAVLCQITHNHLELHYLSEDVMDLEGEPEAQLELEFDNRSYQLWSERRWHPPSAVASVIFFGSDVSESLMASNTVKVHVRDFGVSASFTLEGSRAAIRQVEETCLENSSAPNQHGGE